MGPLKQPWFSFQRAWFMWEPSRAGSLCLKMPFQKWPWHLDCALRNERHLELSSNRIMAATSAKLGSHSFQMSFFLCQNGPNSVFSPVPVSTPENNQKTSFWIPEVLPCATILLLHFPGAKVDTYCPLQWLTEENTSWGLLIHCSNIHGISIMFWSSSP